MSCIKFLDKNLTEVNLFLKKLLGDKKRISFFNNMFWIIMMHTDEVRQNKIVKE